MLNKFYKDNWLCSDLSIEAKTFIRILNHRYKFKKLHWTIISVYSEIENKKNKYLQKILVVCVWRQINNVFL